MLRGCVFALILVLGGCGPDEPPCSVGEGDCANACMEGELVYRDACDGDEECACGFQCLAGACTYAKGVEAACLCDGESVLPPGVPALGMGTHDLTSVAIEVISKSSDGLNVPRDVAFNPENPSELWVVNRGDHSMVVYTNPGTATQSTKKYAGSGNAHFMAEPSALAFGDPGILATIHETDDFTQGPGGTPKDFMGPTLHSSKKGQFNGGHSGHLDMLHNSPNGMGIAWDSGNAYWVFDGYHGSLTRYDFHGDHGLGGEDHSDGVVARYVDNQVKMKPDVPSHMEMDHEAGLLFVADTGHGRIVVLDTASGSKGSGIQPNYDSTQQYHMTGADLWPLVEGADIGLVHPSGLALHDGFIYVTDNATGIIHAFDETGLQVDYLDTGLGPGALMGIAFDEAGRLLLVDAVADQVLRIDVAPPTPAGGDVTR